MYHLEGQMGNFKRERKTIRNYKKECTRNIINEIHAVETKNDF